MLLVHWLTQLFSPQGKTRRFPGRRHRHFKSRHISVESQILEDRTLLSNITVDIFADVVDANDGQISLREAILMANQNPDSDVIQLQAGTYTLSITGRGENAGATGDLDINENVTIIGAGASQTIIDAQGVLDSNGNSTIQGIDRVFHIHGITHQVNVTISGVTVRGGLTTGTGTTGAGGGILNEGGDLTVADAIVTGNRTGGNVSGGGIGGGIASVGGTLLVTASTITKNVTGESSFNRGGDGAGIGLLNANATIVDSLISENRTGDGEAQNFTGRGAGIADTGSGGSLTIRSSEILANTAGRIVRGYGGGIYTAGTLILEESTVRNNSAAYAGGIAIEGGTVTRILDSTIIFNRVDGYLGGAGIFNRLGTIELISGSNISGNDVLNTSVTFGFGGGGIYSQGTIGTIENSTISDNHVFGFISTSGGVGTGGGILLVDDPNTTTPALMTLSHVTLAGNSASEGGGIHLAAGAAIGNFLHSIVAGNQVATSANPQSKDFLQAGTVTIQSRNLIQTAAGHSISTGDNGSLVGMDPLLAPLAHNGGPTQTQRLLPGSPAIDAAGTTDVLATDQRGIFRPQGSAADIGAYEVVQGTLASVVVDTLVDEDDGNYTAGDLSLREATTLVADGGTITFASSLTGGTITLDGEAIFLERDVTITGLGAGQLTIDGNGESRLFSIYPEATVAISGLTLSGGNAVRSILDINGGGGAIRNDGTLTLTDVVVTGDQAETWGGAVFNTGTLTVTGSSFNNNSAGIGGGAIHNRGTATISTSSFTTNRVNSAGSNGGGAIENGIPNVVANLTITDSTLSDNTADLGGAVYSYIGSAAILTGTTISGNTAVTAGGGVVSLGTLTAINVTISGNSSPGVGGGLATDVASSSTTLRNVTIFGNHGAGGGGGYFAGQGTVTVHNSLFAGNTSGTSTPDDIGASAAFGTATHNFVGAATAAMTNGTNGNIVQPDWTTVIDPVLADNGGPTLTHALLDGGMAVNAGDDAQALDPSGTQLQFDQRGAGFARIVGTAVDIGAFELATANTPPVAVDDSYTVNEGETLRVGVSSSLIRYNFDEASSGSGPALDTGAAPATDGTFQGLATRTGNTPGSGTTGALDLTGGTNSNNYISAGDVDEIDSLTEMTITLWVNLQATPKSGDFLLGDLPTQFNAPAGSKGWELRIGNGTGGNLSADNFGVSFLIYEFDGLGFSGNGGGVLGFSADNQWAFIALTCDLRSDLNGDFNAGQFWGGNTSSSVAKLAGEFGFSTTLGGPNDGDLRIGGSAFEPDVDRTPPAWLDDVRIFDRPLTLMELEAVRQEGLAELIPGVLDNDTDADGDPLSAVLVSGPSSGTLTLNPDGSFEYAPNAGFSGTDTFTYKANDGTADSNPATVTITVQPQVGPAPDLTPTQPPGWSDSLVISTLPGSHIGSETFTIGDVLFVDGAWTNAGNLASGPFSVDFTLDGGQVIPVPSPGLNPGSSVFTQDIAYDDFLSAGTHTFAMNIDANSQVAESNETNNVRSRDITLGLPSNPTSLDIPVLDILQATPDDWLSRMDSVAANITDMFTLTLNQAVGLFIDIDSRDIGLSSTLDTVIGLFDSAGNFIASNNDGFDFEGYSQPANPTNSARAAGFFDSALYADLAAGTYYLAVRGADGSEGDYELRMLADSMYSAIVPKFDSLPGAGDTLFLDFDGHVGNDDWGTYTAAPFSLDADGATFSPGDRLAIYNLWRTVAEDFSPFNINVTTNYAGSFDDGVAFHHIITNSDPVIIGDDDPNLLGKAFKPSYNQGGSNDNVAFTFANRHSDYGSGLNGRIMASAHEQGNTTSHEFGHALDLGHYSLSQFPNAIMVTTNSGFSRKTWNNATTDTGIPQNDMAIIADVGQNGIGYRADDHGNTIGTATVLSPVGNTFTAEGVISDLAAPDLDLFKFTIDSTATGTIAVDVDEYINDLDVTLRLLDSAGNAIAVSDPADSFDGFLSRTLSAGTYYVEISSDGEPGEAGQYALRIEFDGAVDTTSPRVSITRASTSPTNADSVVFNLLFSEAVSNVDASDFALALTGSVTANATLSVGNAGDGDAATYTITVDTIAGDGSLGLDIAAGTDIQDAAGNFLSSTPIVDEIYIIDNTAPAAPVIAAITDDTGASDSDGITNDPTLILSGTAEANSVVELTRVGTGLIGTAAADGNGVWTFNYAGTVLPEGGHTFTATASDAAGNVSAVSGAFNVVVDTSAPSGPVITDISEDTGASNSDGITRDSMLIFSGTAEANSSVALTRVGVGNIGTATTDGTGAWTFDYTGTTLAEGPHSFTATATDTAGNTSNSSAIFTVVVDATAPAAPAITSIADDTGTSNTDGITNDPTLVLSGTAEANSLVQLSRVGVGVIGTTSADDTGNWSFNYTGTTLEDGMHSFTATATDAAGNVSDVSLTFNVVIDRTAPAAPVIAAIADDTGASGSDGITSDPMLIFSGTAEANSIVELTRVGIGVIGTITADGSGNWSVDFTGTTLPEGNHSFTATATDAAGNVSAVSAVFNVVVDRTAPGAPVITGIAEDSGASNSDGMTNDNMLILSGTAEANAEVTLTRVGIGIIGATTANGAGAWSFDYQGVVLPDGDHSFTATARDAAGNVSATSEAFDVVVDTGSPAAPVITAITDDTGRSGSDGITSDPTLILSGTAEANSVVELTRAETGIIGTTTADGAGIWSFNYTGTTLPDGTHNFTATAKDTAGNVSSPSATFVVVVDQTPPAAPVITAIADDTGASGSDGITSDSTLVFSGMAEAGSEVALTRIGVGFLGTAAADANRVWSFDYTGTVLPVGPHSFTATATDAAGNTSSVSEPFEVTVIADEGGPTVSITRLGPSPTNLDALAFAVVFSEAVTNVDRSDFLLAVTGSVTADATLIVGDAADSDSSTYTVTVSGIAGDGTLGVDIATGTDIRDAAGNGLNPAPTVDEVYIIDNTAPAVPVITGISEDTGVKTNNAITGDSTLIFFGTAEPGSVVELTHVGEGVIGMTLADENGNWTFDYTDTSLRKGRHDFIATATDAAGNTSDPSPRFKVVVHAPGRMATAPGPGISGLVQVTDPISNELLFTFEPYPGFLGGVRVATGDVNNDGTPDIITGPGPGGGPHIKVIDGVNGNELKSFFAFDPGFIGGVFLASADFNGDGHADIVVGADAGAGPHVRIFSGKDGGELFGFFAFNKNFSGGVRVAVGDVTGDGTPDIIVGAGPGAQPHVRVFDGTTGEQVPGAIGSFFAYSASFRGGVFVAAGRVNDDNQVDVITGADAGGGPHVRVFDGRPGTPKLHVITEFFAYDPGFTGGVRVSVSDLNLDGLADIITAAGPGGGPHVKVLSAVGENGSLVELSSAFVLDPSFTGGVFLAGNSDLTNRSQAQPLRLAEGVSPAGEGLSSLVLADASVVFDAALGRIQAAGTPSAIIEGLATLTLHVADLEGDLLAEARPQSIVLDIDAAGIGWFIDPTPFADEEFSAGSLSAIGPEAAGGVDLLSVILHELGHHLGGGDLDAGNHPEHFLADRLAPGQRRLARPEDLDLLFTDSNLLDSVFE